MNPRNPENHADCPTFFREKAHGVGIDIEVSDQAPRPMRRSTRVIVCPHGQKYWWTPMQKVAS